MKKHCNIIMILLCCLVILSCEVSTRKTLNDTLLKEFIKNSNNKFINKEIKIEEIKISSSINLHITINGIENKSYDETLAWYKIVRESALKITEHLSSQKRIDEIHYTLIGNQSFIYKDKKTENLTFKFIPEEFKNSDIISKYTILSYLGKSSTDSLLLSLYNEVAVSYDRFEICMFEQGVSFSTVEDTIKAVFFYDKGQDGFNKYVGTLPFNLNFNMKKKQIIKELGEPDEIDNDLSLVTYRNFNKYNLVLKFSESNYMKELGVFLPDSPSIGK